MTLGNSFNINSLFATNPFRQQADSSLNVSYQTSPVSIFSGNGMFPSGTNSLGDFGAMMAVWNQQQTEIQDWFFTLLSQMSAMVPHKNLNNFRPFDYNKCYSPTNNASVDLTSVGKSNSDKIIELRPEMQEKTLQLIEYARNVLNKEININSGYRTEEEQEYLRQKTPHLAAKSSAHCEGKAVDISIIGGNDSDYEKLGSYAKEIGMRWGGDFSVKERWHFDYNWR